MALKTRADFIAETKPSWACLGFDVSMVTISGTGIRYDGILDQLSGVGFKAWRWDSEDNWYRRLGKAARGHEIVQDILGQIGSFAPLENVFIGVEQAWPYGITRGMNSAWLYQQAQIHGAFCGGLVRWGYHEVYEVNNRHWRDLVAAELDIKQTDKTLKYRVKEWAQETWNLPDLPDIVSIAGKGKVERPESGAGAKAQAQHPNDIYDAAAVMTWLWSEIEVGHIVPSSV